MKRIIHSHKDLMLEALSYLHMRAGESSLDTVLNRLEMMYGEMGDSSLFKTRISTVRALADAISRGHMQDAREPEYFFRPLSIGQGSLAQVLVFSFYDPDIDDWAAQTENMKRKFSEFALGPAPSLQKLSLGRIFDDSDPDGNSPVGSLAEQLEETGLNDAEKWQLLRVIQNAGSALSQLNHALSPVRDLISANLSLVEPLLGDFKKRWEAYFENVPFEAFLSENIGMEPGDVSGYTLHIYPSIFECGTLLLHMDPDTQSIYMQVGLCLPEGINVKALPVENHLLLEGLKALSDKSKLNILSHIRDKRSYGQELARETGLSTATVSHHMSALISCGFIRLERVENRIYYQMDKENLRRFLQKLSLYLLSGDGTSMPLS